jgi:large subunit ribosomal protein L19
MDIIAEIEKTHLKETPPAFNVGDTVAVHAKITEGGKERVQVFEGVVIARKGGGTREAFTVRKTSHNVGVEKSFLLNSPKLDKVVVKRRGRVRRAKLYYIRERVGKKARIKEARR